MQTVQPGIHGNFPDPAAKSGVGRYVFNWASALLIGGAATAGAFRVAFSWGHATGLNQGSQAATSSMQTPSQNVQAEQAAEAIKLAQQAIGEAKNALSEKAAAEQKLKAVGFFSPEVQHNLQHSSFLTGVVVKPDFQKDGSLVTVGAAVGTDGKPTFVVNFSVSNTHLLPQSEKFGDKLWREGAIIPIPANLAVEFLGQDGLKRLHDNINDRVRDPSFIQPAQFQELLDKNGLKISAAPGVNLQNVLAAVRQRGGMAKS